MICKHRLLKGSCHTCELEEENKKLKEEKMQLKEALEEISECLDSFYDQGNPRKLFPELSKFSGFVQVMDKVARETLNK